MRTVCAIIILCLCGLSRGDDRLVFLQVADLLDQRDFAAARELLRKLPERPAGHAHLIDEYHASFWRHWRMGNAEFGAGDVDAALSNYWRAVDCVQTESIFGRPVHFSKALSDIKYALKQKTEKAGRIDADGFTQLTAALEKLRPAVEDDPALGARVAFEIAQLYRLTERVKEMTLQRRRIMPLLKIDCRDEQGFNQLSHLVFAYLADSQTRDRECLRLFLAEAPDAVALHGRQYLKLCQWCFSAQEYDKGFSYILQAVSELPAEECAPLAGLFVCWAEHANEELVVSFQRKVQELCVRHCLDDRWNNALKALANARHSSKLDFYLEYWPAAASNDTAKLRRIMAKSATFDHSWKFFRERLAFLLCVGDTNEARRMFSAGLGVKADLVKFDDIQLYWNDITALGKACPENKNAIAFAWLLRFKALME